ANLSELELKKILIDKMESNKSIHESDKYKNLYKALVDAYKSDKLILDTYEDIVLFKRRQDDENKDDEPSAGSNQGSKRRRAGKEPESTSAPKEKTSKTIGKSIKGSKSHHKSADKFAQAEEPMHTVEDLEEPAHQEFVTGDTEDKPDEETSQLPNWFQKPVTKSFILITSSTTTYTTSVTKTKASNYGHIKWIEDLVPNTMWSQVPVSYDKESARDVYSKHRIIAVTKLQIIEWNNYKHLDWITVCKLTNLIVEERLDFNVSLRMFTRSIVIQKRVEDLQLAYPNPRGFIYQNEDKKNKLMCIDELHKFSNGTLNDVRTALNDRLETKVIRIKYLPQTIWRQSDKDKAGAMIQAIDKQLKTRRIMRTLEKFVGGRPYEGDFRLLQRTI
ncbi:hypothetical protein Tco_0763176, partial [Tanacetum coccineum]